MTHTDTSPLPVAALFVRHDSVYRTLPGVDCWDQARDARRWPGGMPCIAHPPCGQWGRLKGLAQHNPAEKALALLAVALVRTWGGLLEHPIDSSLWAACQLPKPGEFSDAWGGWTVSVDQCLWGHWARKRTWLYCVGLPPLSLAERRCDHPLRHLQLSGKVSGRGHAARERTPPAFAQQLVTWARQGALHAAAYIPSAQA